MVRLSPRFTLQAIITLDSICYGLIYPFLSPYIIKLGGDHLNTGISSVGILAATLLSEDVTDLFSSIHGRKFALFLILNIAAITHILMILTESYWITITARIIFSLVNRPQEICRDLLMEIAQTESEKEELSNRSYILGSTGYIIGPVISGYMFDYSFLYSGVLVIVLTLFNTFSLLLGIPREKMDINKYSDTMKVFLTKVVKTVTDDIRLLFKANITKNWDVLVGKYFFSSSLIIFFSKYTQIIKHNYQATSVSIGYMEAYINLLAFFCTFCISRIRRGSILHPANHVLKTSFLFLAVLILFACYAPLYETFILVLIPIVLFKTYLTTVWINLYNNRQNESLKKLNNFITVASGLSIPILFGRMCNQIQHRAVIILSTIPLFLSFCIVNI